MSYKPKAEYILAALANGDFQIAKFEESDAPTATYTLHRREGKYIANTPFDQRRYKCDCPAGRHHIHVECKHIDMVEEYKQSGRTHFG